MPSPSRTSTTTRVSPDTPQAAALELGPRFERMAVAYWDEITTNGSGAVTSEWRTIDQGAGA